MRTYAIGDIHGQRAALEAAHERIARDRAETGDTGALVVHIGDLVDRGPDSAGVVEFLRAGIAEGAPWIVLKGNHDRMFAGFLEDAHYHDPALRPELDWLNPRLGGAATLGSYGIAQPGERPVAEVHAEAMEKVPVAHRSFLEQRPLWVKRGEAIFVHAGIRPGVPMEKQIEDDLVWIRGPFLDDRREHGFLVVHGHTHLDAPRHYGNRLNIDSSAGYGGPLSAVVVEGRAAWLLTEAGREPLKP